jgi:hypothetical protein
VVVLLILNAVTTFGDTIKASPWRLDDDSNVTWRHGGFFLCHDDIPMTAFDVILALW